MSRRHKAGTRSSKVRQTPAKAAAPRPHALAYVVLLVCGAALAFSNSFAGTYVLDDIPSIVENPNIRSLAPLWRALDAPSGTTVSGRPITSLTLALNYAMAPGHVRDALQPPRAGDTDEYRSRFKSNLRGYHFANVLIHVAAGLALFGLARRTFESAALRERFGAAATPLAASIALLWLVHPLQTASVTYLVQRAEALMGMLLLLTLYCAIRAHGTTRGMWSVAAVIACALGMGAKESMAGAPLLVLAWDWSFASPRGESFRAVWARRWPLYLALASTWSILAFNIWSYGRPASVGFGFDEWPWWRYLITQAGVILHYLRLSIVPAPLVLDYGWPAAAMTLADLSKVLLMAALMVGTAVAVIRRRPSAFVAVVFFLVLAPSSSVLPIVTEVAAEHRMYLPLASVISFLVVAAFVAGRRAGVPRQAAVGVVLLAAFVLGALTYSRNFDYGSEERIWADTIRKRPANPRARVNYAVALLADRRFTEAEPHLRTAVALDGRDNNAQLALGAALCSTARCDEGVTHLARAADLDPDDPNAVRNLAEAHASMGHTREAALYFRRAVDLAPTDVFLLNQASWLLATAPEDDVRDGQTALAWAERAVGLTNRQDAVSLDSLAVALAAMNRYEEAQAAIRQALAVARSSAAPGLETELRQHQLRFEARQPIRAASVAQNPGGQR